MTMQRRRQIYQEVLRSDFLAGVPEVLPRGAAEPAAERGDRPGGCDTGVHQRLAGGPALPQREGEETPQRRHHPIR